MANEIIDTSSMLGGLINSFTQNITGDLFLTLLAIVFLAFVVCLSFRIPLEFTVPFVLPLLMVTALLTTQILPVFAIFIIYAGVLFVKNFFLTA